MKKLRVAVIDLYEGSPNEGMRGIRQILTASPFVSGFDEFDLRVKHQIPDISFDCYISGGGPGDPREGDGIWEQKWFDLMDQITSHNHSGHPDKKFVFLICHSFQMMCRYAGFGHISKRHSVSFGIFPVYPTPEGKSDMFFSALPDPFYAVDSRSYQVTPAQSTPAGVQPAPVILAMEKPRPHVPYEPAIMAVRFSDEIMGTQFHPEADAEGMEKYFSKPEKTEQIIAEHGLEKLESMMFSLREPDRIALTNSLFLPVFLTQAAERSAKNLAEDHG